MRTIILPGVDIKPKLGMLYIKPQEEGFLGSRLPGKQAGIEVTLDPDCAFHPFTVDREKNVHLLNGIALPGGKRQYDIKVPFAVTSQGIKYTQYQSNNLRLLNILEKNKGEKTRVVVWEIAIISQGGDFFLTCQRIYRDFLYNDGGNISCPQLANWTSLMEWIGQLVKVNKLPLREELRDYHQENIRQDISPGQGIVKYFNLANGVGEIWIHKGQLPVPVVVHQSQIIGKPGVHLRCLRTGDLVRYSSLIQPRNKTLLEAMGVEVIASASRSVGQSARQSAGQVLVRA